MVTRAGVTVLLTWFSECVVYVTPLLKILATGGGGGGGGCRWWLRSAVWLKNNRDSFVLQSQVDTGHCLSLRCLVHDNSSIKPHTEVFK